MSIVDNLTPALTGSANTATKANESVMGKQEFLTLLVAQLQNQDPLNPSDPTEFTAQLAQFSSLEQLFNLNDSMNNLVTSNANADRFATLQTIGKNVAYQDSKFQYNGESEIEIGYQLDGNASEVQLTIQRNGSTVAVLEGTNLTKGNHFLTWDGLTDAGVPAENGQYTFAVSVTANEGESVAASPLIKSEVTGVDLTGNYGGKLITAAGEVDFASILGVYEIDDSGKEDVADTT